MSNWMEENRWRRWTLSVLFGGIWLNTYNDLVAEITPKRVLENRSFADFVLLKNLPERNVKQKVLRN